MPMPSAVDFKAALEGRLQPLAADIDVAMRLVAADETLATFAVTGGELRWDPPMPVDATFFFDSAATALGLLGGGADPMAAFMEGRFRADGNLPLAFLLLGLFRSDYGVEAPT